MPLPEDSTLSSSWSGVGVACLRVSMALVLCGLWALLFVTNLKSLAASIGLLPLVERLQLLRCRRRDSLGSFLMEVGEGRVGGFLPFLPPGIVVLQVTCLWFSSGVARTWKVRGGRVSVSSSSRRRYGEPRPRARSRINVQRKRAVAALEAA